MYSQLERTSSDGGDVARQGIEDVADFARRSVLAMASGTRADFEAIYHPDFSNQEAVSEPPAARGTGPAAAWATAMWLRSAYADVTWEIKEVVSDGGLAVTFGTMAGTHAGDFTVYDAAGRVQRVFPATGRSFVVEQAHFCRIEDGRVIEHWAVRDDLVQAEQLGWIPPSPRYLLACAIATARARRSERRSMRASHTGAS